MSHLQQWLLIAPLVLAAACFAAWRLATPRVRWRVLAALLRAVPAKPGGRVDRWRAALTQRLAADAAGGCAACSRR